MESNGKLVTLETVTDQVKSRFPRGSRVVLCHGVFDLLHPGHLEHLRQAKSLADVLVVTVTTDRFVNKGPGRPYFSSENRALMLAGLEVVDLVALSDHPDAQIALENIRPDFYVKGPDYSNPDDDISGKINAEKEVCEAFGGQIVFTSGPTMSSSSMLNEILMNEENDFADWLPIFREQVTNEDVLQLFESIKNLKILVLGEAIIDEYLMCEALGKSSKDPVLAFKTGQKEQQLGGAFAVAKHAAGLGADVTLLTRMGMEEQYLSLVKDFLPKNVHLKLLKSKTDPTIVKTRFVDEVTKSKVFETYQIGEIVASPSDDLELSGALTEALKGVDLILIADYGHGLISSEHLSLLADSRVPKAVNTQSNAGNRGFNSISKYGAVDVVCLNGSEVSLELKQRHVPLEVLVLELAERTKAKFAAVTNGARGVVYVDERESQMSAKNVPAFSTKVADRVGAGDALFVATSLSWAGGNSGILSAVLGNLAGAASLAGLGNQVTLDKVSLQKHLTALLK